jgi:RNA polymerase sigma-70 factor (ECF subfamily)
MKADPRRRGNDLSDNQEPLVFEDIYETYGERVLNLAFRFTGNEETARDLTQDIFLKVYRNLDRFEHKSHIYTWIYRIAINHITNFIKKERRHRWVSLMDEKVADLVRGDKIDPKFWGGAAVPTTDRTLESAERANIVWSAIQTLPPKYRIPLVLHHYEGKSYKDIAAIMELSLSAVEARIHRAKKQLIKKIEPWLEHL